MECPHLETTTDYHTGEIICSACGLVLNDPKVDRGREWRSFTMQELNKRNRVEPPDKVIELGTTIDFRGVDRLGNKLPHDKRVRFYRLRKYNNQASYENTKALSRAREEIDRLSERLGLPEMVADKASKLFKRAHENELVRGRNIKTFAAASLYAVCRMERIARTIDQIVDHIEYNWKDLTRIYRLIVTELKLDMPVPRAVYHLPQISQTLGISRETEFVAADILREARSERLTAGKNPRGLACSALYIACLMNDEYVTQGEIAAVSGVTEVTIRNRYKGLSEGLGLDIKASTGRQR